MLITPQSDGSLQIESPAQTGGFDMGNRTLFVKAEGDGSIHNIFFARGAAAGGWALSICVNGKIYTFSHATAIGRLWQLKGELSGVEINAALFLEEIIPVVFEGLTFANHSLQAQQVSVSLAFDITPPPAPKGNFKALAARLLPRLPAFSNRWSLGWARWLSTPAPRHLQRRSGCSLSALGGVAWDFQSSQDFSTCTFRGRQAHISFKLNLAAGETVALRFSLADASETNSLPPLQQYDAALKNAQGYAAWLGSRTQINDPLLKSLYVAGLNAAQAMYKEFPGGFSGLVAGPEYAFPPRIYFRDGYWTAQALLETAPQLVRAHLLHLAAGVHADGQCPSGVFAAHLLSQWHAPANCSADWLPDHFDSPAFFVLLLKEYLFATQDWDFLAEKPPLQAQASSTRSMAELAQSAVEYLIALDRDGDGLIEKPYSANDWADNVRRSIWVTYDQALYIAALRAFVDLCPHLSTPIPAAYYSQTAENATSAMLRELWDEEKGYFLNYKRPGFCEDNLSVDTLVALYFRLMDEPTSLKVLSAVKKLLDSSNNQNQPCGTFGTMCVFPPYQNSADLFDKSALPYCYHNGADWPYWNGVMAAILLERHDPAGLEVLTNWWRYSLQQGWLTPVEYYSPVYPVGGSLQGWSSMPAAVLLRQQKIVEEMLHAPE